MGTADTTSPDEIHIDHVDTEWSMDGDPGDDLTAAADDTRVGQIAQHVRAIMSVLKLDLDDENLRNTPVRVAKMYTEVFRSVHDEA